MMAQVTHMIEPLHYQAQTRSGRLKISFSSEGANVDRAVREAMAFWCEGRKGSTVLDEFGVRLMIHEALTNAAVHGNRRDPQKRVHLDLLLSDTSVEFTVRDEGLGFDLSSAPTEWDSVRESGRGLLLIRAYADQVTHNEQGNEIHVRKRDNTSTTP